MKISVVDIGTQSLKHSIFEVLGTGKKLLHYKRYSEANLGENDFLSPDSMRRNIELLSECIALNKKEGVEKTKLLGTEILRKAENAAQFIGEIKNAFGLDIEILSQEKEAALLYEGFIPLLLEGASFAAVNIGGGTTEACMGTKERMIESRRIPFGVKFLKGTFATEDGTDWQKLDAYLSKEIIIGYSASEIFITGVLDFIATVGPLLGFDFASSPVSNHPIQMDISVYRSLVKTLRTTPVEKLKELYPKDPNFCENVAIGQSVYLSVAQKVGAKIVIPSGNDLTDGVIFELMKA